MYTFLRHQAGEPFVPDDLDCACHTSMDENGAVMRAFFVLRIPDKVTTHDQEEEGINPSVPKAKSGSHKNSPY